MLREGGREGGREGEGEGEGEGEVGSCTQKSTHGRTDVPARGRMHRRTITQKSSPKEGQQTDRLALTGPQTDTGTGMWTD